MLQWSRPFYTGGVSVFNYTITANERTMLVRKLNATVTYRPGLIYGDVLVTAINSCGHKSQPATVTIPSSCTYYTVYILDSIYNTQSLCTFI